MSQYLPSDVQISKTLSWLLRHGAIKESIPINSDGFVNVQYLLNHRSLGGKCSVDDIKRIVADNDKKRFALCLINNQLHIKANQGHSIKKVSSLDLIEITDTNQVKDVIHGTFYRNWDNIKIYGLSRMRRNHIHFAVGLPASKEVISGMRSFCEVYIYLNVDLVLKEGIKLYKSSNGVILSPGNQQGVIDRKYFLKVVNAKTGNHLNN